MKIITGFVQPDSGQVYVCGELVSSSNLATRRLIGYLPEHNPLYLDMYVREYLDFVANFYQLDNRKARIEQMIERTGLTAECHKRIGQLSKGYRQRVGLAQALIHEPQVLILDEPTTGLDPNQLVEIRQLISEVGKEKTVLFSTHIMQEVQALCQRVVVINKGNIVADEAESVITQGSQMLRFEVEFSTPMRHDLAKLSSDILKVDALSDKLFQISARSDVRELLFSFATEKKMTILTMRQLEESMEEIFRALTK
jgi:ABC-2 type transport system ATP-binding protein